MYSISKTSRIVCASIIVAHNCTFSFSYLKRNHEFRAYDSISVVYKNDIFGVIHLHDPPLIYISLFYWTYHV